MRYTVEITQEGFIVYRGWFIVYYREVKRGQGRFKGKTVGMHVLSAKLTKLILFWAFLLQELRLVARKRFLPRIIMFELPAFDEA